MAMIYDGFLLVALFAVVSVPIVVQVGEESITGNAVLLAIFRMVLLLTAFLFFGWFWTHGGQTLGMRAWRIRAQKADGTAMDWSSSTRRLLSALVSWGFLGLGYLWILVDKNNLAWHDHLSNTQLVLLPKKVS